MFTPPGYRKRLLSDVERWTESGLISRDAAATITEEYKADSAHAIVTVLAFLFAILAAGGLIALVAANWNAIPREVRVVGLLAVNVVVLGTCLWFTLSRTIGSIAIETSAALSVMSAAASISLIGQIYHFSSNWPGFALAMLCIAGATALVARSSACLWLAAVAQVAYRSALLEETGGLFRGYRGEIEPWTQQDWIFVAFSVLLIGIAVIRWTARSGPWTIFVATLPLLWWIDSAGFEPAVLGRSLVLTAGGIVIATMLAHERLAADRCEAVVSALLGLFALGLALRAFHDVGSAIGSRAQTLGVTAWQGYLAIAAAALLAIGTTLRSYADRTAVYWLAAALAAPFVANFILPFDLRATVPVSGSLRLLVITLVPLALVAVEARLSERRKTFAFAMTAVIAIVCYQVWMTKDLLTLAWVFLGGSALLGAIIIASRKLAARPRVPAGEGAT
jgi:uncharacterized membrane protein